VAGNSAVLAIKIVADAKQAQGEMDRAAQKFGKVGKGIRAAAVPAGLIGGALLVGAKKAVDAASRTQQAFGGLDAVFGSSSKQMKAWATAAADSVGLSQSSYGELATLIGSQLKNAGVPADKLAGKTNNLIKTGADLAAMYGGTTAEAVEALSSALKGEMDPMEKYGASLTQSAIKAEMVAQGTDKLTGKQAAAAKTAATLSLIQKQTADAHGAAAREADSAASAQQRLSAKTENLMSAMGTVLLPVVSQLADAMGRVATFATKNTTAFQILVGVVGGIVVTILALNAAMSAYNTISAASAIVQKALRSSVMATRIQLAIMAVWEKVVAASSWLMSVGFKAAWRAALGPVGLVIIAVALVAAGFVLLYKKSETFRKIVDAVWRAVKTGAAAAGRLVQKVWRAVWAGVTAYVRAYATVIRIVFSAIKTAASRVAAVVKTVFRSAWSIVTTAARTMSAAARAAINAVKAAASSAANWIRTHLGGVWAPIARAARTALNGLANLFSPITRAINGVITAVQTLIGWLGRIRIPKISLPKLPGGFSYSFKAASPAAGPAAGGFTAAGVRTAPVTRTSSPGPTIVVNGALDPEAVARQIQRILAGHQRRIGNASAVSV
jgi:hypothetical protein